MLGDSDDEFVESLDDLDAQKEEVPVVVENNLRRSSKTSGSAVFVDSFPVGNSCKNKFRRRSTPSIGMDCIVLCMFLIASVRKL